MLDKLRYNADHLTGTENSESFKIAYIVLRLDEETNTQILWCRQYKSYRSITKLLNHLINLYEIHSNIVKNICKKELNKVEQISKQSFNKFYCVFIKYSIFRNEDDLQHKMKRKVNLIFRKVLFFLFENFISLSIMTKWFKKKNIVIA